MQLYYYSYKKLIRIKSCKNWLEFVPIYRYLVLGTKIRLLDDPDSGQSCDHLAGDKLCLYGDFLDLLAIRLHEQKINMEL